MKPCQLELDPHRYEDSPDQRLQRHSLLARFLGLISRPTLPLTLLLPAAAACTFPLIAKVIRDHGTATCLSKVADIRQAAIHSDLVHALRPRPLPRNLDGRQLRRQERENRLCRMISMTQLEDA